MTTPVTPFSSKHLKSSSTLFTKGSGEPAEGRQTSSRNKRSAPESTPPGSRTGENLQRDWCSALVASRRAAGSREVVGVHLAVFESREPH